MARRVWYRDTTALLLLSPVNARRLRDAIRGVEAGIGIRISSVDELMEMVPGLK